MVKLFLIEQNQNTDDETYDSAVVAAPDEETARRMHPATGKPVVDWKHWQTKDRWCDGPEHVTVRYLGEAIDDIEHGVVCASFNA